MKKMTSYIVAGVKADNEAVFMQRIGELLEKKCLLEFLTDGVPVGVRITDKEELFKAFAEELGKKNLVEVLNVKISDDFSVQVLYKYVYETRFFKTMEDKEFWEKDSYCFKGEKSEKLEGEFAIEGKKYSTSWYTVSRDFPGIEVWLV
jgi:hypothetical protein